MRRAAPAPRRRKTVEACRPAPFLKRNLKMFKSKTVKCPFCKSVFRFHPNGDNTLTCDCSIKEKNKTKKLFCVGDAGTPPRFWSYHLAQTEYEIKIAKDYGWIPVTWDTPYLPAEMRVK